MNSREVLEQQITKIQEMQDRLDPLTVACADLLIKSAEEIRILVEAARQIPRHVKNN